MVRYTVHITNEAWKPIRAQVHYIAIENHAPENASRWLARLLDAVATLEQLPQRHVVANDPSTTHNATVYRMLFERSYFLFYPIDDDRGYIDVVSFRHCAQQ